MAFHANRQIRLVDAEPDIMSAMRAVADTGHKGPPWESIRDFAMHRSYCGIPLYPRQVTLLRLMFLEIEQMTAYDLDVIEGWRSAFQRKRDVLGVQPDIWERIDYLKAAGARRFPHIQFVGGRRGSKGLNGGILGAEQVAYFYSLNDWQAHFGVDAGKDGYLNIGATSQGQAKQQQFADVRSTILRCKYLQPHVAENKDYILSVRTPADVRLIAEREQAKIPNEHVVATLKVQALSASATAFRGATAFGLFFDEFAHMIMGSGSIKSGEEVYEDALPSLDQFDLDGLCYIPSSPYQKAGKAYSLYQEASVLMSSYTDREGIGEAARHELAAQAASAGRESLEINADPTKLVIQLPSWELYTDWQDSKRLIGVAKARPMQHPPDHVSQLRRKLRNPQKFRVERCLDPDTRVLCADYTWRRIDDLRVGDELVGFDEYAPGVGAQRKMRTSAVRAKFDSFQKAYRITFDDGSTVTCSEDHRWLSTKATERQSSRWRKIAPGVTGPRTVLGAGDSIRFVAEPWADDNSYEAGYLAGFMDGEGTLQRGGGRSGWQLSWAQLPGEVSDEVIHLLKDKGFTPVLRRDSDPLAGQWDERQQRTRSLAQGWAINGFAQCARFLGSLGGVKLRRQAGRIWEGKALPRPHHYGRCFKQIVTVEELAPQRLVDIETSTSTFIAEGFATHNCAQWADVEGAYFDPGVIDRLFAPPPGGRELLEPQSRGYLKHAYRVHCDPGKTGANMALAVGHVEEFTEPEPHSHVIIDLLRVWKPADFPPDPETGVPTIHYPTVRAEIAEILTQFPSTTKMSFDQWSSIGEIQTLRQQFSPGIRISEVTFTERENYLRFEKVKSALNLGWVSSYPDLYYEDGGSLLEMELRFLQEKGGRVVKQDIGPVTTKDLVDAFSVVVADLLHSALERWGKTGNVSLTSGSTNIATLRNPRAGIDHLPMNEARSKLASLYGKQTYEPARTSSIRSRDRRVSGLRGSTGGRMR